MSDRSGIHRSTNEQGKKRRIELKERLLFSWSWGKDSAELVFDLRKDPLCEFLSLLMRVLLQKLHVWGDVLRVI